MKLIKTSSKGHQDYDLEVMLHLIIFGFIENTISLRKLEPACRVDVRFMYLSGGIKPSFMAFQRFIHDIFYAINQFLIQKENINTDVIYVDGTKIEANANKYTFVWKKSILNYREKLYLNISKACLSINNLFKFNFLLKILIVLMI